MPVKRGDKVAVITRSLCRYEGNYLSMNVNEQTFTLSNVRAFGTENRQAEDHFPAVQSLYECVEFKAGEVHDLKVVDFHELRDPAIVNMGEHRRNDNLERNPLEYFRGSSRESTARSRSYNHSSRSYGGSGGGGGGGSANRSFRNDWIGVGSQSDGSFPRRNPGAQGNTLEEFDFQKGIEEFTRLKLNESVEDVDSEKQSPEASPEKKPPLEDESAATSYDKHKSFFDNLSGAGGMLPRKPQPHQRINNPNVETFGLDMVQQLYDIRRYSSDQRNGYRSREGFRRYNNRNNSSHNSGSNGGGGGSGGGGGGGGGSIIMSHGSRARQSLGPFQNAVQFHQ